MRFPFLPTNNCLVKILSSNQVDRYCSLAELCLLVFEIFRFDSVFQRSLIHIREKNIKHQLQLPPGNFGGIYSFVDKVWP